MPLRELREEEEEVCVGRVGVGSCEGEEGGDEGEGNSKEGGVEEGGVRKKGASEESAQGGVEGARGE